MGKEILSLVSDLILEDLHQLAIQEVKLSCCVRKEQEKLRLTVSAIKATLEEVENGKHTITKPVADWLGKLKDVLYEADDVLDDFRTEALIWKMEELDKSLIEKVCSFLSCSNPLIYFVKMGHRIKDIRERLDDIEKDRAQFDPRASHSQPRPVDNSPQGSTHSASPSMKVIGRDVDVDKIVELLMKYPGNEDAEKVSVIPIIGMGGVGKTTLARLVYNDHRIKTHFHIRTWVCVSNDFDLVKIAQTILKSLGEEKCDDQQMESVRCHLGDKLKGKKYLLVLDDLWIEDHMKWVDFENLLENGVRGCRILITARNKRVAEAVGSISSHDLSCLFGDNSWAVLKQCAFRRDQQDATLEKIGKEIVAKCGGLPLVLSALGSLLRINNNENYWKYVRDSEIWMNLTREKPDVLPVLRFSYINLSSSHLKHCFAYCSLFPKGYKINKEMLIKLWMAQGFLQSLDTSQYMEDMGDHYVNVLLSRYFFQDVEEDDYGSIVSFRIHDLMHALAKDVAESEYLSVHNSQTPITDNVRHMSLFCQCYQGLSAASKLRTFLNPKRFELLEDVWLSFRHIRVLFLKSSKIQELSDSISELKHLRYLDVSYNDEMKTLPESFTKLQNLQTLNVTNCNLEELPTHIGKIKSLRHLDLSCNYRIKRLPDSMSKLKNLQSLKLRFCWSLEKLPMGIGDIVGLRHIDASGVRQMERLPQSISKLQNLQTLKLIDCDKFQQLPEDIGEMVGLSQLEVDWDNESIHIPSGVGQLTCLQRLPLFIVGKKEGEISGSRPTLRVLHGLNNLRGALTIAKLENATASDAKEANLKEKQYLRSLSMKWNTEGGDSDEDIAFLEALKPHRNIKELKIDGYKGTSFPTWMMKMTVLSFPHLVRVNLRNCRRCQNLPSLGQLPFLECLYVNSLQDLVHIKNNSVRGGKGKFFPSLKKLELCNMQKLKEWSRIVATKDNEGERTKATLVERIAATMGRRKELQLSFLSFPCLSELTIISCLELNTMPLHPSLEKLELLNVSKMLLESMTMVDELENPPPMASSSLSSYSPLGRLISLNIDECNDLMYLPEQVLKGLTSLQYLSIYKCRNLMFLPEEGLRGLTSLRYLSIRECHRLISLSLGMQYLTALEGLSIEDCKVLNLSDDDGMHGLQNLRKLHISFLPKLVSLPKGLQQSTSLQSLEISHCKALMHLPKWLGIFASLEILSIEECPNLVSLPQGMLQLTALRTLSFSRRSHLSR